MPFPLFFLAGAALFNATRECFKNGKELAEGERGEHCFYFYKGTMRDKDTGIVIDKFKKSGEGWITYRFDQEECEYDPVSGYGKYDPKDWTNYELGEI